MEKLFFSSDTHQSTECRIVTERLTEAYTHMRLHVMGYVELTPGVANWELFASVYLNSPNEKTRVRFFIFHFQTKRVRFRVFLWSTENKERVLLFGVSFMDSLLLKNFAV